MQFSYPEHVPLWKATFETMMKKHVLGNAIFDEGHCISIWLRSFSSFVSLLLGDGGFDQHMSFSASSSLMKQSRTSISLSPAIVLHFLTVVSLVSDGDRCPSDCSGYASSRGCSTWVSTTERQSQPSAPFSQLYSLRLFRGMH